MLALFASPAPKPERVEIKDEPVPDRAGYNQTCARLGVQKYPTLTSEEVLAFMKKHDVPLYDLDRVNRYMDMLAIKEDRSWAWHKLRESDKLATTEDGHWPIDGRSVSPRRLCFAIAAASFALFCIICGWCSEQNVAGTALFWIYEFTPSALTTVVTLVAALVTPQEPVGYCGYTSERLGVYQRPVPHEHLRHALLLSEAFPELSFFVSDYKTEVPDPFIMCTTHTGWRIVFGMWDEPGFGS